MSNPTVQTPKQPAPQRRRSKPVARSATFRKQTAKLEGRRDGTPLIFGWGRHLSRAQKSRIQQTAAYGFFAVVGVAVLAVFIFGLLQQLVFIPNSATVKVGDVGISQNTYRKALAYNAQDLWNTIKANQKKLDDLSSKAQSGDNQAIQEATILTQQLQVQTGSYAQAQITQSTLDQLVDDQLIQQAIPRLAKQDPNAAKQLTPTSQAIDKRYGEFKDKYQPGRVGEKYADFLSKNSLSEGDVKVVIAMQLRREMAQTYLAAQLTSPTRQAHVRHIETSSDADAQKVVNELNQKKLTAKDASWGDLAKKYSLDPNTKDIGGDMGWIATGANDAALEIWALDPARKVGDLKSIATVAGTFDVVQVLEIDPHRAVNQASLDTAKANARDHYLGGLKKILGVSTPDQDALQAQRNLPQTPDLAAKLPNYSPGAPQPVDR